MNTVDQFEIEIAKFFGSPYAVATDCCTHAIELCLRLKNIKKTTCPSRTYISVPMTLKKLGITWKWQDISWQDYYFLGKTNIVDAAVLWKENSYIPGTLMCLSFQFQKTLSLGRGGAILCEDYNEYTMLKKMSHDGRIPNVLWKEQDIDILGYHYYMTIDTAQLGLDKLPTAKTATPRLWNQDDYPYLPNLTVFKNDQSAVCSS
jgi:dTDP-4-amino-4,6-dideoxygalactose transaminase